MIGGRDYRPYFKEPCYTETNARSRSHSRTNTIARGNLYAGIGRALLTPLVNAPRDDPAQGRFRSLPLAGYGNRHGRPATGVRDDFYVKAVALRIQFRGCGQGVFPATSASYHRPFRAIPVSQDQ